MIKNFGVDFTVLEKNQKLKPGFLQHQRIMESHIAAYAKEMVKALAMQYVPTDTVTPSGDQMLRERTWAELSAVIDRGISIAELTYQRMGEKGWLVEVPPIVPDLLEPDGGAVGFGER